MKALRIILMLGLGVGYWFYRLSNPDQILLPRLVALLGLVAIYWLTRLVAGKEVADTSPLAADPMPSLSLSERALDEKKSSAQPES
jgi:hypothetical protein